MRYRLQRHDGTDCSATMVPITVLRMVPIQRYRHLQPPVAAVILREGGRSLADADQFSCILIVFLEKFQQCSLFRRYSQKRIAYFFYRYE